MKPVNICRSYTFRALFTGLLVLVMLVPMGMIESIIEGRGHVYRQVSDEITAAWGGAQLVAGPVLGLSYLENVAVNAAWSYETRYSHLRPVEMTVDARVDSEIRSRGIYRVPVYTVLLEVRGRFDIAGARDAADGFDFDEGHIQIPVSNGRSVRQPAVFTWDNEEVPLAPRAATPGSGGLILAGQVPARLLGEDTVHEFSYRIALSGSEELAFVASSGDMEIDLEADWPAPGFFGIHLPDRHDARTGGFTASWRVNDYLADIGRRGDRDFPYDWFSSEPRFGVALVQPVDTYQLVTRAAKYAVLFIGLTFLVYFLAELFAMAPLHPVQYLLVGMANCVFYLLLLSLAEHVDFRLAYLASAGASTALISLYSSSILKSRSKGFMVMAVLTGLYAWLYVTLRSESYALLAGSTGLFMILGAIMYLTRNIDWHRSGAGPRAA